MADPILRMIPDRDLRCSEVAALWGVSRAWVWELCRRGKADCYRLPGCKNRRKAQWRVRRAWVLEQMGVVDKAATP